MRLDAYKGDTGWQVYHAEECCFLRDVVWLDSDTNEVWRMYLPPRKAGDGVAGYLDRARRIEIFPESKLVIINPIEDSENISIADLVGIPMPALEPA